MSSGSSNGTGSGAVVIVSSVARPSDGGILSCHHRVQHLARPSASRMRPGRARKTHPRRGGPHERVRIQQPGADEEIDDPGRDPEGPRPAAQSVRRRPRPGQRRRAGPRDAPGTEGESMMPEAPTEDDDAPAGGGQRASHSAQSAPAETITAGPVSTVVRRSTCTDRRPPGRRRRRSPRPAVRRERRIGRRAGAGAAGAGLPHATAPPIRAWFSTLRDRAHGLRGNGGAR